MASHCSQRKYPPADPPSLGHLCGRSTLQRHWMNAFQLPEGTVSLPIQGPSWAAPSACGHSHHQPFAGLVVSERGVVRTKQVSVGEALRAAPSST